MYYTIIILLIIILIYCYYYYKINEQSVINNYSNNTKKYSEIIKRIEQEIHYREHNRESDVIIDNNSIENENKTINKLSDILDMDVILSSPYNTTTTVDVTDS